MLRQKQLIKELLTSVSIAFQSQADYSVAGKFVRMGTGSIGQIPRISLILLVGFLCASASSTKKAQWLRLLDWNKQTFLFLGDDIISHVARTAVSHKPNITEGQSVRYALAVSDFYLQDENGRVFKFAVVKTELDPTARERLKSGIRPCQLLGAESWKSK